MIPQSEFYRETPYYDHANRQSLDGNRTFGSVRTAQAFLPDRIIADLYQVLYGASEIVSRRLRRLDQKIESLEVLREMRVRTRRRVETLICPRGVAPQLICKKETKCLIRYFLESSIPFKFL